MAKDKKGSKAAAAPAPSSKSKSAKPIEKVKAGRVTKPAETPKSVSKDAAKKTAKVVEKSKKAPSPSSSSDEDEDDDEDDETSASSDSSDSEEEEKDVKPKTNGAAKSAPKKAESESDDSSDDDDEDDSEDESSDESEEEKKPAAKDKKKVEAPKTNGTAKAKASSDDDSEDDDDSDDSDDSDADEKPAAKAGAAKDDDESAESDDSEEDDEDSSDSDEEEAKEKAPPSKKRKAEEDTSAQDNKKSKVEDPNAVANLFIGNLSWSVDEEWLTREFEEFGELVGVRIITDRDTQRSKGFGYVEFKDAADAAKAMEAKNGAQIDGREIRMDFSTPRSNNNNGTPQQRSQDRQKQYGDVPSEPSATLFVGNISFNADQDTVTEVFQEYGTINGVRMPTDKETGAPKGFGYVEMGSIDEAKAAFEALQGADIAGRAIRLDYAKARDDSNAGGRGGGFGGRGGRGGFGDRGGRGGGRGGRGGFGDRGGRGRGGARGGSTNRGGFGDFQGKKMTF